MADRQDACQPDNSGGKCRVGFLWHRTGTSFSHRNSHGFDHRFCVGDVLAERNPSRDIYTSSHLCRRISCENSGAVCNYDMAALLRFSYVAPVCVGTDLAADVRGVGSGRLHMDLFSGRTREQAARRI